MPSPYSPWHEASRAQNREHKRVAILRAAARLFAEKGFHATSLDHVAEELHVSKPTVYYYLKSKDEILFECVRMALEMIDGAAREAVRREASAAAQLAAVMHQYAEIMMMEFGLCLFRVGEDPLPPESRRKLRKLQASIDLRLRSLIAQGIREKSFAPVDPKLAAFAVAGALNSIARWYRPEGALSPQEIAARFVDMTLNGLAARPPAARKSQGSRKAA